MPLRNYSLTHCRYLSLYSSVGFGYQCYKSRRFGQTVDKNKWGVYGAYTTLSSMTCWNEMNNHWGTAWGWGFVAFEQVIIGLCTGSRSKNALNINSSHSPTEFLQLANLTTYKSYLCSVYRYRTRSSSVVTLARPSVSSSLQITNRFFRYASPHLWNQLPSSFRQPHCVHSPPGSSHPAHITSSQSLPSFSPSVTPSTFHSRLKTHLFHKSFPP